MIDDELLLTAVHDTGIRRLQHAYADVVNRRAWAELEELFLPDAAIVINTRKGDPLRLVGGTALGEFIGSSVTRFSFFEFEILNAHIVFPDGPGAGSAVCRLYMCEHRQEESSGRWTNAFGLYHDRYRFDDGRWWFAQRDYHSLARHGQDLEVFPFPEPAPLDVPGADFHS
ncbi:MAG TPA: nuclear transport factor 2 family protein [Acidimicrobiales bacterium]|nr:nuclear transport factor 2 family protein [Acidimicrobiales bacterium]